MKTELSNSLTTIARREPSVRLLTGDLGYGAFDQFREQLPSQFLNCGVAEQNMVGTAAGLSSEGLLPIVYSIGNFLVLRAAEQIRNDIVGPRRPVLLIAAGAGFSYGAAGYSHHLTEDLAFLRSLPSLRILTPSLPTDLGPMLSGWLQDPAPAFLRLDRSPGVSLPRAQTFRRGHWRRIREGQTVGIFSVGSSIELAIRASDLLNLRGVPSRVVDCNQLTDIDRDDITANLSGLTVAVAVEEHSTRGGLGSLLAEEIASRGACTRLLRFGLSGSYPTIVGPPDYMRERCGMTPQLIADAVTAGLDAQR